MNVAKVLIGLGVLFIIIGVLWMLIGRFLPLGKLPGDIVIKRENITVYFPIMTSIIVSILLSLLFFLFRR
ncbi:DUF2905 domain-containing protein [Halalkalibacter hemicellulosilyticus]|uniref:DUF2905 domain-containing protein n=1 Tax=Halalkalibacter hemicellulosilyticusJCM 9152 TaxID=1236971 RepID=W4QGH4_9BACI|nr:DUF2905 domain-containing protein [Halalkalibacter hemicellulosilyticus]GAE30409.1 hypothetical protein JCM9152_1815 [Halalkalibacter hemicellulosilyticusJCM 9152]